EQDGEQPRRHEPARPPRPLDLGKRVEHSGGITTRTRGELNGELSDEHARPAVADDGDRTCVVAGPGRTGWAIRVRRGTRRAVARTERGQVDVLDGRTRRRLEREDAVVRW